MSALALQHSETAAVDSESVDLLVGIWRRLLPGVDVQPGSNFFDLGGDSLLAITLFLEIERATGRRFPLTVIYEAPTVCEQAALLDGSSGSEFSPLVLLKPGTDSAPLFIFHGVGGTVVEFAALGKLIDIPGEVYAVQAQGIDGTREPLERVEDMAQLYFDAIRAKQPSGPYWLCGYSFGGLLALEVARRLKAVGEDIALLFMIDAYAHPLTWPRKSRAKVKLRRFGRSVLATLLKPSVVYHAVLRALERPAEATESAPPLDRLSRKRLWLVNRNPALPLPLLKTRLAADEALYRYQPEYYDGDVVFLKARRPDPDFPDDPKHVWRHLVRSLQLHTSPGSHMTIIKEHAADVATRVNACIRQPANWQMGTH